MKKKFTLMLLSVVLIFAFSIGPSFSAIVGLRPVNPGLLNQQGQIEVPVRTEFEMELFFDGLSEFPVDTRGGLVSFAVDILWDPLIELKEVTGDPRLSGSGGFFSAKRIPDEPIPMEVELGGTVGQNFEPFDSDSIVLATLLVNCAGFGITELVTQPHFDFPFNWSLEDGTLLDESNLIYTGIEINQVPIPSTIILLGGGLATLVALRRRRS